MFLFLKSMRCLDFAPLSSQIADILIIILSFNLIYPLDQFAFVIKILMTMGFFYLPTGKLNILFKYFEEDAVTFCGSILNLSIFFLLLFLHYLPLLNLPVNFQHCTSSRFFFVGVFDHTNVHSELEPYCQDTKPKVLGKPN